MEIIHRIFSESCWFRSPLIFTLKIKYSYWHQPLFSIHLRYAIKSYNGAMGFNKFITSVMMWISFTWTAGTWKNEKKHVFKQQDYGEVEVDLAPNHRFIIDDVSRYILLVISLGLYDVWSSHTGDFEINREIVIRIFLSESWFWSSP